MMIFLHFFKKFLCDFFIRTLKFFQFFLNYVPKLDFIWQGIIGCVKIQSVKPVVYGNAWMEANANNGLSRFFNG